MDEHQHRGRRIGAKALLVVGCVVLLVANLTVWLRLTALDTDRFVSALRPLSTDTEVQAGLAVALTDRIVEGVDVQGRVETALPNDNPLIVATVTRLARSLILDAVTTALESDAFATVWTRALERTHRRALQVIDGADGSIALELTGVLDRADAALEGRGLDLFDQATIDRVDSIVVARSDQLQTAKGLVDLLRTLAIALPIAAVVVFGLVVLLAPDRRRAAALVGVGAVVTMVVTAVALRIARRVVLDEVDGTLKRHAVDDVWGGLASPLVRQTVVIAALGLLLALGAWLAGPSEHAATVRGWFHGRRPSGIPAIAAHLRPLQAAVCVAGAVALLVLPDLTVTAMLVILALAVTAVVALQLLAGGQNDPKLRQLTGL